MTNDYRRVNLISKGSNFKRSGDVDPMSRFEATGGPLAKDCVLNDRSIHYKTI